MEKDQLTVELLNSIPTSLEPITQAYWENMHVWPYEEIARRLDDRHIVDLGAGCGLLSVYLVYHGYVETSEMWDARPRQIQYAESLVQALGLTDRIKINKSFAYPEHIQNKKIIAIRYGSLLELEKFNYKNKLITLRRTKEVDLYFKREENLPWNKEIITRPDGFQLEYMEFDYNKLLNKVLEGERWMEEVRPEVKALGNNYREVEAIGGDYMIEIQDIRYGLGCEDPGRG